MIVPENFSRISLNAFQTLSFSTKFQGLWGNVPWTTISWLCDITLRSTNKFPTMTKNWLRLINIIFAISNTIWQRYIYSFFFLKLLLNASSSSSPEATISWTESDKWLTQRKLQNLRSLSCTMTFYCNSIESCTAYCDCETFEDLDVSPRRGL